ILAKSLHPFRPGLFAARAHARCKVLVDTIGHQELGVLGPPIGALAQPDLFLTQWFAMSRGCVVLVWRAIPNVAVQDDQRRFGFRLLEGLNGTSDPIHIVRVMDARNVPSISEESGRYVLAESDASISFDCDVVVVVNPAEVIEAKMRGERRCLR